MQSLAHALHRPRPGCPAGHGETWETLEPLIYKGNKDTFTVKRGFQTDFASVPRAFTWLVPRHGRYTRAAVLHDHLCNEAKAGRFQRHDADGIFRRVLRELDVSFLRRWLMWAAVRFGAGWRSFWRPGLLLGLGVLLAGLVAISFFLVPVAVVALWLALFWVLEWIVFAPLKLFSKRKRVNPPRVRPGS